MQMMSKENELQHFGIPGMKWGQRRSSEKTERALNKMADAFANSSQRYKSRAHEVNTYARNLANPANKISPTGSQARSLAVKSAKTREAQYLYVAKQHSDMVKGIKKAQKLVQGMPMKQAASTLETSAGYSRGAKAANAILFSKQARLSMATFDYAMQQTKMGEKS